MTQFFIVNQRKIFVIFFIFIFFASPFLIQSYLGELDYSERIGVIKIDFHQKIHLLKYYLINLLRIEFLLILILIYFIHRHLNKNQVYPNQQILNINPFFYFILISIISPFIFFIISPKLISIYHFLGILLFSLIFYLIISLSFILVKKIKFKENQIYNLILILIVFILNIYIERSNDKENKVHLTETQNIQILLEKYNLIDTKNKLFTNDLKIMNLWLLNKNKQLIISDGFTNSLKNEDIEYNLINNLKYFGISNSEFKKIL